MNLNKVFLIGRLTSDPQLKNTMSGQVVATFNLATNRIWIDKQGQRNESTQFHNIVVWGRQAEIVNQFLKKGSLVFVEGRIQSRIYQNSQGQNIKIFEIVAEKLQLGPKTKNISSNISEIIDKDSYEINEEEDSFPEINLDLELEEKEEREERIKTEDIPF